MEMVHPCVMIRFAVTVGANVTSALALNTGTTFDANDSVRGRLVPVGPVYPVVPVFPLGPMNPCVPWYPVGPVGPVGPIGPIGPSHPW